MEQFSHFNLIEVMTWNNLFYKLSLKRIIPFYSEIGLPDRIIANPAPLILIVQKQVKDSFELYKGTYSSLDDYCVQKQSQLFKIFEDIASEYDSVTSQELYDWCLVRYVDHQSNVSLYKLGWLFSDVKRQKLPITRLETELSVEGFGRLGALLKEHLPDVDYYEDNAPIESLNDGKLTEWEEWLQVQQQRQVADEDKVDLLVATVDSLLILRNYNRTLKLLKALRSELSLEDFGVLITLWQEQMQTTEYTLDISRLRLDNNAS